MKECTNCRKRTNRFSKDKRARDGLSSWCKDCYSEASREYRKTKDGVVTEIYNSQKQNSEQRNIQGPIYSRQKFKKWLFSQNLFYKLYDNWVTSDYKKDLKPSVDRIDDYKGYLFDNIQIMTWGENRKKGDADMRNGINNKLSKSVIQYNLNGDKVNEFYSVKEAERQTGINDGNISSCCNGIYKTAGGFIWKYKDNI